MNEDLEQREDDIQEWLAYALSKLAGYHAYMAIQIGNTILKGEDLKNFLIGIDVATELFKTFPNPKSGENDVRLRIH